MSHREYTCTRCETVTAREMLTVKKVSFQEVGLNPATLRARNVAWLCPSCVAADADWQHEAYAGGRAKQSAPRNLERLERSEVYREIMSNG